MISLVLTDISLTPLAISVTPLAIAGLQLSIATSSMALSHYLDMLMYFGLPNNAWRHLEITGGTNYEQLTKQPKTQTLFGNE